MGAVTTELKEFMSGIEGGEHMGYERSSLETEKTFNLLNGVLQLKVVLKFALLREDPLLNCPEDRRQKRHRQKTGHLLLVLVVSLVAAAFFILGGYRVWRRFQDGRTQGHVHPSAESGMELATSATRSNATMNARVAQLPRTTDSSSMVFLKALNPSRTTSFIRIYRNEGSSHFQQRYTFLLQ